MPHNYLVKYVEMLQTSNEYYDSIKIDLRDTDLKYNQHQKIWRLITDKEREEKRLKIEARTDDHFSPNTNDPKFYTKQPRNVNIPNYNFEQYTEFTKLYDKQMEKDRQKQYLIRRIFKYIKENPDKKISKSWKRKLLYGEGADNYNIDRFVDQSVSIDNFKPPVSKRLRRTYIRTRTSRDISNYDCWRNMDRKICVPETYKTPTSKIILTPAQLIHCFGDPLWNSNPYCCGEYTFEDNNLDIFLLCDPHSTTYSRGINKDDEYYAEQRKTLRKNHREPKYPNPVEFWTNDIPRTFFIYAPPHAEFRKFKVWIRKTIAEGLKNPSFKERMDKKYGHLFSNYDDYNTDYDKFIERGVKTVGAFNFIWSDFLSKDEKKQLKNSLPELPIPPEYISPEKGKKAEIVKQKEESV